MSKRWESKKCTTPPISSKEAPPYKQHHDQAQRAQGPILLQQQLPINPHGRPPILPTILPQPPAHLAHALETVAAIEQILDILGHDLGDVAEVVVELVEVLRGAAVLVGFLGALDEGVEVHEGVGAQGGGVDGGGGVGRGEFVGEVAEVGEGEFARVGAVGDGEEADGGGY